MRFSLAAVLAAAGLVAARVPCYHTSPPSCERIEGRNTGHHTIEGPAAGAAVHSPFSFKFSDTTRNPGDTSHLQLSFYNLTNRYVVGTVQFSSSAYTDASASVSVPAQIANGAYALVVTELDGGNQLYQGDVEVHFTR